MTFIHREITMTNEIVERPFTESELNDIEKIHLDHLQKEQILLQAQAAKAAILEKLGLTVDEAKLFLS